MSDLQERRNRKLSGWVSIGVTTFMLVLFYFLVAWREPFPPIPSYGIELSFGIENTGRGDNFSPAPELEAEAEQSEAVEEPVDEVESDQALPREEAEIITPEVREESVITSEPQVQEKAKEKPKTEAKEAAKTESDKTDKQTQSASLPSKEVAEQPKDKGATDVTGKEGKKEGTINAESLYNSTGSEGGASLAMAGWTWDSRPTPQDNSSETGKVIYKIKVDQDGYIIGIELVSSTLSPQTELLYRHSIEKLTFTKISEGPAASISVGEVTFIIKTK